VCSGLTTVTCLVLSSVVVTLSPWAAVRLSGLSFLHHRYLSSQGSLSLRCEDKVKVTERWRFGGPDIDFVGSGWTFLEHFFLPNQSQAALSNIIVDHHAAFFRCVPLPPPAETWAISRHD
jgi:hypothetical protein